MTDAGGGHVSNDFGMRSRARAFPFGWIALGVAVVGLVAFFVANRMAHEPKAIADAKAWSVSGPPCAPLTRAAFAASGPRPAVTFAYDEVTFSRRFGAVACNEIVDKGGKGFGKFPVCQFSSPAALAVHAADGDHYYAPDVGQPVTISAPHGRVSCVLGSSFSLSSWPKD